MKIANVALSSMKTNGRDLMRWLQETRPDLVTLQKTGLATDFPTRALGRIGYNSRFLGRRSASDLGVGILSNRKMPDPEILVCRLPGTKQTESRCLTVRLGDLWVASVYAPCPPPISRTVDWLNLLRNHVRAEGLGARSSLLCGDFNVHADGPPMNGQGRKALHKIVDLGFTDLYREAHPDRSKCPGCTHGYGLQCPKGTSRLHLILGSKSLTRRLRSASVNVDSRPWPRKDSPPLVVDWTAVMSLLNEALRSFDRKERFAVLHEALGFDPEVPHLARRFREKLNGCVDKTGGYCHVNYAG